MVTKNEIQDWQNIFLDTSIVIALLAHQKGSKDRVFNFVHQLISYLSNNKSKENKDRQFLVSAISLSEILCYEDNDDKIAKIVGVIGSENVEIIAFDQEIALQLNNHLHDHITNTALNKFAQDLGYKSGEFAMVREWIHRDYMIVISAANRQADAILSTEKKNFLPVCNKADVFCALTYPELFNYNDAYFFQYYSEKVADFLNSKKKQAKAT